MSLKVYRRKRDFKKTSEPSGKARSHQASGLHFVVQKHAASHLHYDFRLELDGVLKSWAVPKGPSLDPSVKALAVQVEDHPLDYAKFEGTIPKGEYGGGTVMVWDRGTWKPEADPGKELQRGRLSFELFGEKLRGKWSLVRMAKRGDERRDNGKTNWLLFKRDDDQARAASSFNVQEAEANSVLTGRTLDEIAAKSPRVWKSNRRRAIASRNGRAPRRPRIRKTSRKTSKMAENAAALPGARPGRPPESLTPQLTTLVREIPTGDDWLHELKFDGYRILAWIDQGQVSLKSRRGKDWTKRFPTIADAVAALPFDGTVLDGEVVALDEHGLSSFQRLQNWVERGDDKSLVYYAFDVPYFANYDLTQTPLIDRKQFLADVLLATSPGNDGPVRYSDFVRGRGEEVVQKACRSGSEGIVSKRADSPYETRRSRTWVKTKCQKRQEFVIGGYSRPERSRIGFGALLLGYYRDDRLVYCGRVGTGFTRESLSQIHRKLKKLHTDRPPFDEPPTGSEARGVMWVRPQLVCEVEFTEWTDDGRLRHPSFQGLREDKSAREIGREEPVGLSNTPKSTRAHRKLARNKASAARTDDSTVAGIPITHPDRVVFPDVGITKLELARYFDTISEWILPHVAGRPLTLVRCPQGQGHACFYQKHLSEAMPDAVGSVEIREKSGTGKYVVIHDVSGLVALSQVGVLEIHPWGARADNTEHPDRLVFDLDPGPGASWKAVIAGAREVREILESQGLQSFVRTSGGKGLHVVAPLVSRREWHEINEFAAAVARFMADRSPELYTANMRKAGRQGKIFVDYLRNQRGATAVASYSSRARPGALVATPLRWDELSAKSAPGKFSVGTIPDRLRRLKRDPWEGFFSIRQNIASPTAVVPRGRSLRGIAKR